MEAKINYQSGRGANLEGGHSTLQEGAPPPIQNQP